MNHTGSRYLETDRLILRKLTITDADSMFDNWAKDESVTRYIGWNAHASIEETREFLQSCIHAYLKPDTYNWAIVQKDSHTLIGTIGTSHQSEVNRSTEIGYIIGSRWWNQGYATEALSCVLPYLLKEVGFDLVEARCFQQNQASSRVMQKVGMHYDGSLRLRVMDKKTNTRDNLLVYSLLSSEL